MNKRSKSIIGFGTTLAALSLGISVLAQEDNFILDYSSDYLNDITIAVPQGEEVDTSAFASEGPYTIGFINWSSANSWTTQIDSEVIDEASRYPQIEEFIAVSSEGDANRQISQIEDMIVRGVDALLIIPTAPDAIAPALEEAAAAGIPVIVFGATVNTDAMVTEFHADPVEFGRAQGDWLMETLGCEGNIIVLNGVTGISTSDLRRQGLLDAIEACPDGGAEITILAEEDAAWAYDQGQLAVERMLAAYPEIDGVWSQGGAMTQGAIDAFEAAGRPLVPMTGEDNNGFMLAWMDRMEDGFQAMAASEPTWQSRVALQAALTILQGQPVNSYYSLNVPTIFNDQVADYVRPEYNDGFWTNSLLPAAVADELYLREDLEAEAEAEATPGS